MTDVLEAALAFIAMVATLRAVAFIRIRGATRSEGEARDLAETIALDLAPTR